MILVAAAIGMQESYAAANDEDGSTEAAEKKKLGIAFQVNKTMEKTLDY